MVGLGVFVRVWGWKPGCPLSVCRCWGGGATRCPVDWPAGCRKAVFVSLFTAVTKSLASLVLSVGLMPRSHHHVVCLSIFLEVLTKCGVGAESWLKHQSIWKPQSSQENGVPVYVMLSPREENSSVLQHAGPEVPFSGRSQDNRTRSMEAPTRGGDSGMFPVTWRLQV